MKRYGVFLAFLFFLAVQPVFAHLPGQPPFFKIEGKYSDLYPVASVSLDSFELPQDIGPDMYLVNTPIEFEIDTEKMPVPKEIIEETTFLWDFGDGSKGKGLKNTHYYKKPGSYLLSIDVVHKDIPEPQLIQSVLFHVLPAHSYILSTPVISVNGKKTPDPIRDFLEFAPGEKLTFDASGSKTGTASITMYYWDFGDGTTSTEKKVIHTYPKEYILAFPMLRVTDSNGFISDTFVQINNDAKNVSSGSRSNSSINLFYKFFPYIIVFVVGVLLVCLFLIFKNLRKKIKK